MIRVLLLTGVVCALSSAATPRTTVPLDGTWEVEESVSATDRPSTYGHKTPVPGLANLAQPAFPDVDKFDSRELINNMIRKKVMPESEKTTATGTSRQKRNYFWYRRTFDAPARREVAILQVNKAQFTTAVWINGKPAGEHAGCFTAGYFDLSPHIRWGASNEVVIRVGAHPNIVPPSVPAGTDFEKLKWTPGIYDSVELHLSDNPVIETVQVAPDITRSRITVETRVTNHGSVAATFAIEQRVKTWKGTQAAGSAPAQKVTLKPGESRAIRQTVAVANAHLWSPEDPFLYVLETSTGGDSAVTRFGMREFRFDTPTRRAYLNGKPYFMRGSNITLHRFFEDPKAGALAWNEAWVRKLLVDIPKRMHWNSFRLCIGPVPQKWLDIADEAGLLLQYEYFIWTSTNRWHNEYGEKELTTELSEWVRDNWNHPSVVLWDSCNETIADVLGDKVIPAVRKLDLSGRAWENGYNQPAGPDDPYEDHPYLFSRATAASKPQFRITDLEKMEHEKHGQAPHPSAHASILNEYGWIWLNRDGSPTLLTKDVWDHILGPDATGEQRLKHWSYLLAGLTEFWRAHRFHAGVLHFVYLTCSVPGGFTSDHWTDVEKLELNRDFEDYVGNAFKPLGVYLNFFQPELKGGSTRRIPVSVINDHARAMTGKLVLTVEGRGGEAIARMEKAFDVPSNGQNTYTFDVAAPSAPGSYVLRAVAGDTVSRRMFEVK